jgi:hypothetical protein
MSEPLTPADCDLTDFAFMPLEVARLRGSDLASTESPEACWAALMLWSASWHNVPAASLSDDERVLAKAAGYGRDVKAWRKVSAAALRGFQKASDGLLYHPVVAVKALEAWIEKLAQRMSGGEGNAKRWGTEFDKSAVVDAAIVAVRMLKALDPKSKTLVKKFVMGLPKASGSDAAPIPPGVPPAVPVGSQEKGMEEKEKGTIISNIELDAPRAKSARAVLAERIAAALGVPDFGSLPPNVSGNLMAEVESMIAQSCDWLADIAPALARKPDGKWPGSPTYWTRIALSNRDRRAQSPAKIAPAKPAVLHPNEREKRIRAWLRNREWASGWGPGEGEGGCCITPDEWAEARKKVAA